MDKKTIDKIVWFIPIKSLRDNIRELLYYVYSLEDKINNLQVDNIRELLSHISSLENKINNLQREKTFGLYLHEWHIDFWKENITNDLNKLISNLDEKSVYIVMQFLNRIIRYIKHNETSGFDMDTFEIECHKEIKKKLNTVVEISGYKYYNNLLIPAEINKKKWL